MSRDQKRLAEAWRSYERDVLPATAGTVQRQETRRGFYAGARALFAVMTGVAIDDVSEDQGANILEALNQELHAFAADVAEGRA